MRAPRSTYRLQVRRDFDLHEVAVVTDYLSELGADWLYLSPLLKASGDSDHGYDVVDHSMIDPDRGGLAALENLSRTATRLGMRLLIDVVPNHMGIAVPSENRWWWDVLSRGRQSRYAEAFDIDWDYGGGRLRLPVLGDGPDELAALAIDGDELRYYDLRLPIAAGTADDGADAVAVHARQHYELVNWRRADSELNYRRFFAVNSLAAVRAEVPWVFQESHAEILDWVRRGLVEGIRVDHPDGLMHPGRYLDDLATALAGRYVLVEKILEGREQLPATWATSGTTGYDALGDVDRVLTEPTGRAVLDSLDAQLRDGRVPDWHDLIHDTKRAVADGILNSEVRRITRELQPAADDAEAVADVVAELLACFPVYRSYLPWGAEHLLRAAEEAARHRPDLVRTLEEVVPLLSDPAHPAAKRFQQTSGMVMAKGVEDCAFYRYTRLGSLTEVGADPSEFSISIDEFHERQQVRQAAFPLSMTTLSTHDTKRGEDVRARLAVLAEIPKEWERALTRLRELSPLGDGPLESLLWQAVIGAWPISADRLHAYAEKAAREAGNSTSWGQPNEEFERRMHALIDAVFEDERVTEVIERLIRRITEPGWSNSLAAKLVQLTMPGVPDVYQGSELWEQSLVDPDNRRPVDFGLRRRLLARLQAGELPPIDESGLAKMLVTTRALRLRRDHPEWFTRYRAIPAYGVAASHALAFDRGRAITVVTRMPVGLAASGGWRGTVIHLPSRPLVDAITGTEYDGGDVLLGSLFARFPVALLTDRLAVEG